MTRLLAICIMWISVAVMGQTPGMFNWPTNVPINGEGYTLMSALRTNIVIAPNGQTPTENNLVTHRYRHHTRIATLNGTVFIAYSSSVSSESDGGMQCAISSSRDRGVTWSAPVQVVPSQTAMTNMGESALPPINSRISQPRNFTIINGQLYLTCAVSHLDDTEHWQADALISCPVYNNGTIGSIFLSATNLSYYSSNGLPQITYNSALGPTLLTNSILYGVWLGTYGSSPWYEKKDEYSATLPDGFAQWVEPNTFSIDGSTNNLYRIWRGNRSWSLWWMGQQWSTNGGATWTLANTNSVPNGWSEIAGIRLSTGQYAIVGNPQYTNVVRNTLMVALTSPNSTNITNVGAVISNMSAIPVYSGYGKQVGASYPSVCQVGNYLYISYSIHKESIGFSRVLIPGLTDNNNDYDATLTSISANNVSVGTITRQ